VLINGVKVRFFNAKWSFLEPKEKKRFNIATIKSIAIMKINVLFLRAKFRDYYDIYFLVKEKMTINQIYKESIKVLDGITYKLFITALLYIDDIDDDNIEYLEPIEHLSKSDIRDYFQKEIG